MLRDKWTRKTYVPSMHTHRNARKSLLRNVMRRLIFTLILILPVIPAYGQLPDFDDLYVGTSNDFTLEVETEEPEPTSEILITVDPVRLVKDIDSLAVYIPEATSSQLVYPKTFQSGDQIKQGSQLFFNIDFHAPKGVDIYRNVHLYSKLENPENELHEDVEFELNTYSHLELKWQQSKDPNYLSYATRNDHVGSRTRPDYAEPKNPDRSDYYEQVSFQTANLKPSDYYFMLQVYRKDGDEIVEENTVGFPFTLVDAPITIEAFIPNSIKPYNVGKSLQTGEYEAGVSDWAVPPYQIEVESSVPGFSLDYSGEDMHLETGDIFFDLVARPKPNTVGKTANLTLRVTDGLGRKGVTHRQIRIIDGRNAEIKVTLPQTLQAGRTVTGTVSYPSGFKLKKPPRIGDARGFEWTNSDYTAFRLTPQEEGVHHQRLFAIIASGTMAGMDDDPVLVWKREYSVESQDLIYDEDRNQRRTAANNKIWSDAIGAVAQGIGAAASAYGDANSGDGNSNTASDENYDDDDEGFQAISPPIYSGGNSQDTHNPNYDGINVDTGPIKPMSTITSTSTPPPAPRTQRPNTSVNNPDNFSIGVGSSSEITEANVCGVAIIGTRGTYDKNGDLTFESNDGWIRDRDDNEKFDVNGRKYDVVLLTKLGIRYDSDDEDYAKQIHELAFYKHNCAQAYETIPTSTSFSSEYEFYDNGGKKLAHTENADSSKTVSREWDRTGNHLSHYVGNETICDNGIVGKECS